MLAVLVGPRLAAQQRRNRRMQGLARRFRRNEQRRRRHRSRSGGAALHQRAHRGRCGRVGAASPGGPFTTPVVVANMRPHAFDHVRLRGQRMDDRSGAPALAPANAPLLGIGGVAVVVLASDTLLQDDLQGEESNSRTGRSVQNRVGEASRSAFSCGPDTGCRDAVHVAGTRTQKQLVRGTLRPAATTLHRDVPPAQLAGPAGGPASAQVR